MSPRVLYLVHNHPDLKPGGAQQHALELFQAVRDQGRYRPMLVAQAGMETHRAGAPFRCHAGDPDQYLFHTREYTYFWGTLADRSRYTVALRDFLAVHRPDVVHVQHLHKLGWEVLHEVRRSLPAAPIVYTLHEFMPLCQAEGKLYRPRHHTPCLEASPARCHGCFPDYPPQLFWLRERFVKGHLEVVDRFLSPSEFLRERFVDWGIPAGKIQVMANGRPPRPPAPSTPPPRRDRFGFFGALSEVKGLLVLLDAFRHLLEDRAALGLAPPSLRLHGSGLEEQPEDFQRRVHERVAALAPHVHLGGRYEHPEVADLLAEVDWVVLPSLWWENSPMVIQEAFLSRRPVLCAGQGGMAEKIVDEVSGLHFRPGDPVDLARVMARACDSTGLWERLVGGIPPVATAADQAIAVTELYDELRAARAPEAA